MKSYTDLEQSKKLAEILPLESADMYYKYILPKSDKIMHIPNIGNPLESLKWYNEGYTFRGTREAIKLEEFCIPAWSLSVLMGILPHKIIFEGKSYEFKMCTDVYSSGEKYYDLGYQGARYWLVYADSTDLVDACVEMIIKLKERDLL